MFPVQNYDFNTQNLQDFFYGLMFQMTCEIEEQVKNGCDLGVASAYLNILIDKASVSFSPTNQELRYRVMSVMKMCIRCECKCYGNLIDCPQAIARSESPAFLQAQKEIFEEDWKKQDSFI